MKLHGEKVEVAVEALAQDRVRLRVEIAGVWFDSEWLRAGDVFTVNGVEVTVPVEMT